MPSLLAGQVQLVFDPIPTSLPHVKSGRLRALAISTSARSPAIPDLPTVAEAGVPGYESSLWYGVLLPARTPPEIVARLNKTVNAILREPDVVSVSRHSAPSRSAARPRHSANTSAPKS